MTIREGDEIIISVFVWVPDVDIRLRQIRLEDDGKGRMTIAEITKKSLGIRSR